MPRRAQLAADQAALAEAGIPCVLRVNAPLAQMARDIAAADLSRLAALMVPKCADPRPLLNAAELSGGAVGLIALVETPAALFALPALTEVPQVVGLMLGSEDYSPPWGSTPRVAVLTPWPRPLRRRRRGAAFWPSAFPDRSPISATLTAMPPACAGAGSWA